jgi:hypothetical protein
LQQDSLDSTGLCIEAEGWNAEETLRGDRSATSQPRCVGDGLFQRLNVFCRTDDDALLPVQQGFQQFLAIAVGYGPDTAAPV